MPLTLGVYAALACRWALSSLIRRSTLAAIPGADFLRVAEQCRTEASALLEVRALTETYLQGNA
jgi:hypothetical protein